MIEKVLEMTSKRRLHDSAKIFKHSLGRRAIISLEYVLW